MQLRATSALTGKGAFVRQQRLQIGSIGEVFGNSQQALLSIEVDYVSRIDRIDSLARALPKPGDAVPNAAVLAYLVQHLGTIVRIGPRTDVEDGAAEEFLAGVSVASLERIIYVDEAAFGHGRDAECDGTGPEDLREFFL